MMGERTIWAMSDGRRGMENQCLGLAERLGGAITLKRVHPRPPWAWCPEHVLGRPWPLAALALGPDSAPLGPPYPDVLVACGRQTIAYSILVRSRSGGRTFTVQTQDPRIAPHYFDLVIPPEHDGLAGPNVVPIIGAPHRVTAAKLAAAREEFAPLLAGLPRPLVSVLIGGSSRHHQLTDEVAHKLAADLGALKASGHGLAITTSRRTTPSAAAILRAALAGPGTVFTDGAEPNPYFGLLALADFLLVTDDSTNMVAEAAATGVPLYVIGLPGHSPKHERFLASLRARGIGRPFEGRLERYTYAPLDETARAAEAIEARLAERRPSQSRPSVT